jgi:hypothetical protein
MDKSVLQKIVSIKHNNLKNNLDPDLVKKLIFRVTQNNDYIEHFSIEQIKNEREGYDEYRLFDRDDKIVIQATNGISACVAFNYYLKNKCHSFETFVLNSKKAAIIAASHSGGTPRTWSLYRFQI